MVPNCPSGALSLAVVACSLVLMAQPSLYEKFGGMASYLFKTTVEHILSVESTEWELFNQMHALGTFRMRS
eukprot:6057630-Prymnesium_polylepis.1